MIAINIFILLSTYRFLFLLLQESLVYNIYIQAEESIYININKEKNVEKESMEENKRGVKNRI